MRTATRPTARVAGAASGRRVQRHVLLLVGSAGLVTGVYLGVPSERIVVRLSLAFAYVSLALLAATLLIGPLRILRGRRSPTNSELRRDVGIWAACLALIHVVFGLQVHMGGRIWMYFVRPPGAPSSAARDAVLASNYLGLGATLVLLLLLAISNDVALRRLGTPRWKRWQRCNYLAFAMIAAHGAVYIVIESRATLPALVFSAMVVCVLALQLAGAWLRRARGGDR